MSLIIRALLVLTLTLAVCHAQAAVTTDSTTTDSLRVLQWTGDTAITVRLGDTTAVQSPTLPPDYTGCPVYVSSDTTVATVDSLGVVTPLAVGCGTITALCPADSLYAAGTLSYTLTVLPALKPLAFVDCQSSYTALLDAGSFAGPSLPADYTGTPVYTSSDESLATVDSTGLVTLHEMGVVTITALCPADSLYAAGTLSYQLMVGASQGTSFYADGYVTYDFDFEQYPMQSLFVVTDAERRTVTLGDGIDPAIDENVDGTFVCPKTVTLGDVPYTVAAVAENAFARCHFMSGVQLPATVTAIGQSAFEGCYSLTSVDLGGAQVIGPNTFKQCSHLVGLTLPASLRTLSAEAFGGNSALRYIDARKAGRLQLALTRDGDDSPFASLSQEVIVYAPTGSELTGQNIINTDTAGRMTCELMVLDSTTYSAEQCAAGAATYRLNVMSGAIVFGQRLGTDAYPFPCTLQELQVHRLLFYNGDTLRATLYANHTDTLAALPDAATLHITDGGTPAFFYYSSALRTEFTSATGVGGDLTVYAYSQHPAGTAGHVLQGAVTTISEQGDENELAAYYRITDAAQGTVQLGDGTYCATAPGATGTLVVPASVMAADSTPLRVTAIGDRAIRGLSKLTAVELPDSVTSMGTEALSGCSRLLSLTLPPALTHLGDGAMSGSGKLRYIDARPATGLTLTTVSRDSGAFAGTSDSTIVYLPQGIAATADSTLRNIVLTDSAGRASCSHFVVAGTEYSPAECRSGAAAYALRALYGGHVFGQRLGTDSVPLPLADEGSKVLRVQFVLADTLVAITSYVNCGAPLSLPTPAQLGFSTSQALFTTIQSGSEVTLTDSTIVLADMVVLCEPKSQAGEDGYIFTAQSQFAAADAGTPAAVATTCRITSYERRTATVGDGRHTCLTLTADGSLVVPDSVTLDSVAYAVTAIAASAFKGNDHLTAVSLPATLTAIGDSAFARCGNLARLTLPSSVDTLGKAIVASCGELSYLDMRQATSLAPLEPGSGALGQCPAEAIVYLPVGHPAVSATNVVCTDSTGLMSCAGLWVDRLTLTDADAASGRATWMLNDWALRDDFGQRLGTDPLPVPSTDSTALPVRRVKVYDGQYLKGSAYANDSTALVMPTAADMGYSAGTHFTYGTYQGNAEADSLVAFDPAGGVTGDTAVWLTTVKRGDINANGLIDVADVTAMINYILQTSGSGQYADACDMNGDGAVDMSDASELINLILEQAADTTATTESQLPTAGPDEGDTAQRDLNVLVLGNSFSCDAYNYVPWIMFGVDPNVRLRMSLFVQSGGTLQTQLTKVENDELYHLYYRYRGNFARATYFYNIGNYKTRVSEQMGDYAWDVLLLQQASQVASDINTYQPYLKKVIHWVKHHNPSHIDVGFLLTHSYPQGSRMLDSLLVDGKLTKFTSDEMYRRGTRVLCQVLNDASIDFVIPAGTAIQNARTTYLDTLGYTKHLGADRMHLQDGAGCMAEGYAAAETLLRHMGRKASIWDEKTTLPISQSWCTARGMPWTAYPVAGMEPSNIQLVKLSVKAALDAPFTITDLSATKASGGD